jgi:glycosyltransferase involved in cell wall biosynthesis
MRVLIIQETDWLKRYSGQQHHLAEILSLRGHHVRVIDYELLWKARGRCGLVSKREVFPDVSKVYEGARVTVIRPSVVRVPLLDYFSLVFSHRREIDRQIREFRPDVIVGFGILNSRTAAGMTRKGPVPFVYYWIDVLHTLIPVKCLQPIGRMVERGALRKADRVVANCQQLKEYVLGIGAPAERTAVVSEGIDIDRFDPAADGGQLRERLGFGRDDVVLLFMGWLYSFSGLREVARDLRGTTNAHMKLLVVGKGDLYGELQEMARTPELEGRLLLAGERPYREMPEYVSAADICLLPAYADEPVMQHIVPIKVFEYLAGGRPVISTRLPGVMAEFGEGHGVVYVDRPEDVLARADEMSRAGRLRDLGSQGRRFVEKNDWNSIADDFERVLQDAVAEKRSRFP